MSKNSLKYDDEELESPDKENLGHSELVLVLNNPIFSNRMPLRDITEELYPSKKSPKAFRKINFLSSLRWTYPFFDFLYNTLYFLKTKFSIYFYIYTKKRYQYIKLNERTVIVPSKWIKNFKTISGGDTYT